MTSTHTQVCLDISIFSHTNSDPTLTLSNLTALLENVNWYNVGRWIGVPLETLDMMRDHGGDDSQCRKKCWEFYLKEYPSPSWKKVADALYSNGYIEELEVVQKIHLKGG